MTELNESTKIDVWIEDGIVFVVHHAHHLTLDAVKEGVGRRLRLSEGKSYPMFSDIRSIKSADKEVRGYLAKAENSKYLLAGAMIVKSVFQETIGNIFIFFNKPPVPARLFRNEKDAILWLQQFKEK